MYIKNNKAFTFVELIIVITILAILATIWFWSYQSYLASGRDTNRLIQLKDIHDGLERYSINSRLPFPEDMVEIQASWNTFAYQWYAGDQIIKTIGYDWGGKDLEYGTYLTYMLSKNKRSFQLLTYVDDNEFLSKKIITNTYANQDYTTMFPKVIWSALWVLIDDESRAPIQEVDSISSIGTYDVITGTWELISYFSDNNKIQTSQWDDFSLLLENKTCARIKELWNSTWNGEYIINPTGSQNIRVYCDMETAWWGWTFAWHMDGSTLASEMSFSGSIGTYTPKMLDTGDAYMLDMGWLLHTEMMALINTSKPQVANEDNSLLLLKYWLDAEMFHTDNLLWCTDKFWESDGYFYKMYLDWEYTWSNIGSCGGTSWTLRPDPYNPGWLYLLRMRESWWSYGTERREQAWTWTSGSITWGNDVWFFVR